MQRPAKGIKITGVLGPCDPRSFDPGGCKEGSAMAPFAVRSSMPRTFLLVVGCVLACAFLQPAVALAQRAVAHPAAGGRVVSPRVLVPPVQPSAAHTTISRPRVFTGQRPARAEPDTFPFHQGPVKIFRHRVYFGPRFFWFGPAWWFNYGRWPNYCPYWSSSGQPGGSIMDGGRTTVLIGVGDLTAAARLSLPMGMVFTITSSYPHMNIQRTSTFPETATWCGFI